MKSIIVCLLLVVLNGCSTVAQYPTTIVSTAIWGTTGKTTTDHALSFITGKDCVTLRIFSKYTNEYICEELPPEQPVYTLRGLDKVAKR